VVVGFDYHVGVFCRKMNAHSTAWRFLAYPSTRIGLLRALFRIGRAKALIRFGGPAPHPLLMAAARVCKVPIFVIWAGSDVTLVLDQPSKLTQAKRSEITHLAVAPWLADELKQAGIKAQYIPIIGLNTAIGTDVPREFNVLTYLPGPRRDFYGKAHVYEVARRLPDTNFLIVGPGAPDSSAPSNVRFLGWLKDITPVLDQCTVVLRVPEHDGMSLVVLEALAHGKFVVWKYLIPGVKQVTSIFDTCQYLDQLRVRFAERSLGYNSPGVEFIAKMYDERQVTVGVQRFLDQIVDQANQKQEASRHIAIAGLEFFAADLAFLTNKFQTGWKADVLQFETRYEMIGSLLSLAKSDALYTVGTPALGRAVSIITSLMSKPRIVHWVGSDILVARRDQKVAASLRKPGVTHLTEVGWESEELRSLGIHATIAPLPPRFSCAGSVPPLPRQLTLLTYLPATRADFYGRQELELMIRAFRGKPVKFLIVGGGTLDATRDAVVENLGWCYSLADVYPKVSALFRFTPRDGLSLMVLESLSFGRFVLWTKNFPFVNQVSSSVAAIEVLNKLLDLNEQGMLTPQVDAAQFIQKEYDRKKCIDQIASAWDAAILKGKRKPSARQASER